MRSSCACFCAMALVLSGWLAASEHVSTARVMTRDEQKLEDTWDLTRMYAGVAEWTEAYSKEAAIDYDGCMARVDMTTPQPIEQAIQTLNHLLDRFETLLPLVQSQTGD